MDVIESLDVGVYSHFEFQAKKNPGIVDFMQPAYYISGYVGVSILVLIAVGIFLANGKSRSALVVGLLFACAIGLIELVRFLVPRSRPSDAVIFLGPGDMVGSYPSRGVFLFILGMVLIGLAAWPNLGNRWLRSGYVLGAAALSVWVCMSQFFLMTNFLSDILGGIAGAAAFGWLAARLVEEEPPPQEAAPAQ